MEHHVTAGQGRIRWILFHCYWVTAITALHEELRQGDDAVRRTGFRLNDAAGWARKIAQDLQETASDMARIAARPDDSCAVPWGVCPEHGNTLTSTGGTTRCRTCGRTWGYNRDNAPCAEPATHRLTDADGVEALICDGHAIDVRSTHPCTRPPRVQEPPPTSRLPGPCAETQPARPRTPARLEESAPCHPLRRGQDDQTPRHHRRT
ncbi:hypothetical protein [Nonomuraea dietziae]|uniref:Uncharacterized protein n=1 Tax=Nonomuraea dietziae TaxID=65515 RepID=A0A7W5Y4U9_9ACTN|nr:hypothetical protein [Nonomuraea dietziae]MBB3724566.1 hypothetical protein [Nonomuraea dietziae]